MLGEGRAKVPSTDEVDHMRPEPLLVNITVTQDSGERIKETYKRNANRLEAAGLEHDGME